MAEKYTIKAAETAEETNEKSLSLINIEVKWISSSGLHRRRRLQAEPETKTGGVFQLINVQTNSFTYIALPDPLSTRLYLPQINIPWPNILFILFRHFFLFFISFSVFRKNLKRLRNELRNGLTHNSECMHLDTVLAKFFIPIYRCIISFLSFSLTLSLIPFVQMIFINILRQVQAGENRHSSHACPFPCAPHPAPCPYFHLLCHCARDAGA